MVYSFAVVTLNLDYSTAEIQKRIPVTNVQLGAIFARMAMRLKREPEWLSCSDFLGAKACLKANILFCDDTEMKAFQKQFRGLARTTDVLSFPTRELTPSSLKALSGARAQLTLGDIVVSISAVERGAKRAKRSVKAELMEVVVHGLLHLVGFDHVGSKSKATRMRALQREVLSSL